MSGSSQRVRSAARSGGFKLLESRTCARVCSLSLSFRVVVEVVILVAAGIQSEKKPQIGPPKGCCRLCRVCVYGSGESSAFVVAKLRSTATGSSSGGAQVSDCGCEYEYSSQL